MQTHGEQMLAEAESRSRRIQTRRRIVLLAAPVLLVTTTSTSALIGEQEARAIGTGASGFGRMALHVLTVIYAVGLVALPAFGAARTRRAIPAMVAFAAGPIITPMLFGSGGWRWWEIFVVGAVSALIATGAMQRRAARGALAAT